MSDPDDIYNDAMQDQAWEDAGKDYFNENWYELVPQHARESMLGTATLERTKHRPAARASLVKASEALDRGEAAVAYFHVRRAVEGYIGAVFVRPIFNYLQEAIGGDVALLSRPLHSMLREGFIQGLKQLTIRILTDDADAAAHLTNRLQSFFRRQTYRNDTFHSLFEPDRDTIEQLRVEAENLLDEIDAIIPREERHTLVCEQEEVLFVGHRHSKGCYKIDLMD